MEMEKKVKGNRVFLIGAAKCGTTTVDQMLRQHPQVFMSPIKEPNYFSTDIDPSKFRPLYKEQSLHDLEAYFKESPLPELHLDFVREAGQYEQLFAGANGAAWLGESSTSYLVSEEAPHNIASTFPDAKYIVCLRNPVHRLISHLKMALQGGNVSEVSDEMIEVDWSRPDAAWGVSEMFLELGLYGQQLERWFEHVPKEHFHVVFFEDLIENQQKVFEDLCAFLNVSIFALESTVHANASGVPRFPKLNAYLKGSKRVKGLKDKMPEKWVNRIKAQWHDDSAEIDIDETRWRAFYKEDVEKLESLLGRSLEHWK